VTALARISAQGQNPRLTTPLLAHTMTINELAPLIFVTAALLAVFLFFT
jgi:hypothetical protein